MVDFDILKGFIRDRLPALNNLGMIGDNLAEAVGHLLDMAEWHTEWYPDWNGGYHEAIDEMLLAIATIWKHHQSYGCWVK